MTRLTLEQLAEVSGVSARTLSDMERGRSRGPQHRTVTALADALALDGDDRKQLIELAPGQLDAGLMPCLAGCPEPP
ncbi:helix-turn-helix domain-containing protein [Streptomyces sp. NPDC048253]|uniref:helix-turn-helix domain-containing protein n=1 Tax=Streptomyces sp. NPDC048253 TaxID=3365524 RepID=UPI003713CF8C